jgi:DNA-binding MarR family transcriptional regulator
MPGAEREDDLGALFARITRRLIAAEEPILERHGLTMWEYIALTRVARGPAGNQLALAKAINYDKTRLVRLLDRLEQGGLVAREADPADRRSYLVRITPQGKRRHAAVVRDIRAMEDALLATVPAKERTALHGALARLAEPEPEPDAG